MRSNEKKQVYQLFVDLNDTDNCKYPKLKEKFLLKILVRLLYNIEQEIELEFSKEAYEIFKILEDDPLYHEPDIFSKKKESISLLSIELCY